MSFIPLPTDLLTNSVEIIEWEHARIHDGKGFTAAQIFTLANNATNYHLLRVGAATYPHIRTLLVSSDKSPIEIHLHESPTVTTVGTAQTVSNNNRNSATASGMSVYSGATIAANGALLASDIILAGKSTGGAGTENAQREWCLKPSTDYIIRLVSVAAGAATYNLKLFWYEA